MELLNGLISNSKLIRIPDSGHRVLVENPDEISRIIIEFLRG